MLARSLGSSNFAKSICLIEASLRRWQLKLEVLIDERDARAICKEIGFSIWSAHEIVLKLCRDGRLKPHRRDAILTIIRLHHGFTPDVDDVVREI
jgi:hypothetical protein